MPPRARHRTSLDPSDLYVLAPFQGLTITRKLQPNGLHPFDSAASVRRPLGSALGPSPGGTADSGHDRARCLASRADGDIPVKEGRQEPWCQGMGIAVIPLRLWPRHA